MSFIVIPSSCVYKKGVEQCFASIWVLRILDYLLHQISTNKAHATNVSILACSWCNKSLKSVQFSRPKCRLKRYKSICYASPLRCWFIIGKIVFYCFRVQSYYFFSIYTSK